MFRSKRTRNVATSISNQPPKTNVATDVTFSGTNQPLHDGSTETQPISGENSSLNKGNKNNGCPRRNGKKKQCSVSIDGNSSTEEARDWIDDVNFDEREDVRTIDPEGKVKLWSGSIQPHDVWHVEKGVRFEVTFNRYYQPIRKGGSVLVKFISDVAKKDDICPIKLENWRNVNETVQADITELIRGKFIIPDGQLYNDAMIRHVGKHRRQWKFELKAKFFNPTVRTRREIENHKPGGIVRANWLDLVDYWYSDKSKKYAHIGREARALLGHLHTNGSTSFANTRDVFETEHGREPSGYEFFDKTHQTKEGAYPNDTNTEKFINMAKSKIETSIVNSSSSKPRVEIENEVFDQLMYDKDKTNQRPVGYGFGVKRKDVIGVHALLRKRGIASTSNDNEAQSLKVEFSRHNRQTTDLLMRLTSHMGDLVSAVRSGRISNEMLDATDSALHAINAQNVDASSEDNGGDGSNHSGDGSNHSYSTGNIGE